MLQRVENFEFPSLPLSAHCELLPHVTVNVLPTRIIPTDIVKTKGFHTAEFFLICYYSAGAKIPIQNPQAYHKSWTITYIAVSIHIQHTFFYRLLSGYQFRSPVQVIIRPVIQEHECKQTKYIIFCHTVDIYCFPVFSLFTFMLLYKCLMVTCTPGRNQQPDNR